MTTARGRVAAPFNRRGLLTFLPLVRIEEDRTFSRMLAGIDADALNAAFSATWYGYRAHAETTSR